MDGAIALRVGELDADAGEVAEDAQHALIAMGPDVLEELIAADGVPLRGVADQRWGVRPGACADRDSAPCPAGGPPCNSPWWTGSSTREVHGGLVPV
jgi:hypothetical protein